MTEARVRAGISLADAARELNIAVSKLAALEEGDFSVFAAEVYGRGVYLRYAAYLGVNDRQAERLVSRALTEARERVPLKVHTPLVWWERIITSRNVIVAALAVLALIVGGYITWQVQSFVRLPLLRLTGPASAVAESDTVAVTGAAEQNARVTVNGEAVLLQEDGKFEVELRLHPGINVIYVEAENAAGRVRAIERHLLLPRM